MTTPDDTTIGAARDPVEIGRLFARRREAVGLSQEQIPDASSATVGKLERGDAAGHRAAA